MSYFNPANKNRAKIYRDGLSRDIRKTSCFDCTDLPFTVFTIYHTMVQIKKKEENNDQLNQFMLGLLRSFPILTLKRSYNLEI